jgi:hypothetical protein
MFVLLPCEHRCVAPEQLSIVPEPAIEMRLRRIPAGPDSYEAVLEDFPAIRGTGLSEEDALTSLADFMRCFIREQPPCGDLTAYGQLAAATAARTRGDLLVYLGERRARTGPAVLIDD